MKGMEKCKNMFTAEDNLVERQVTKQMYLYLDVAMPNCVLTPQKKEKMQKYVRHKE